MNGFKFNKSFFFSALIAMAVGYGAYTLWQKSKQSNFSGKRKAVAQ